MSYRHAPRGSEPLRGIISLEGPSNSGKTYSALLLATGMARVLGCKIAMLDTELRGNLYESEFEFERYILEPPFTPDSFTDAYQELDRKFGVVITDNFSDEYEGPGGIAEMAANSTLTNEVARWAAPKLKHKAMMGRVRLLKAQHIFCLRASDKIAIEEGEDRAGKKKKIVVPMGWQPHAEKNFSYDMTLRFMLPPNSMGRVEIRKTIGAFKGVFNDGEQLTGAHGEAVARWTRGEAVAREPVPVLNPPFKVLDADGEVWRIEPMLRDAIGSYRDARAEAKERGASVTLQNLSLLRFAASKAGAELRQRIEAEIAAAQAVQSSAGDLDSWGAEEPAGEDRLAA
jgi:hypothetical protein